MPPSFNVSVTNFTFTVTNTNATSSNLYIVPLFTQLYGISSASDGGSLTTVELQNVCWAPIPQTNPSIMYADIPNNKFFISSCNTAGVSGNLITTGQNNIYGPTTNRTLKANTTYTLLILQLGYPSNI